MGLLRIGLALAVLLALAIAAGPAGAASTTGSGGVLASPLAQGAGGGGLAPGNPGVTAAAETDDGGTPPVATPAQEETPTTPEGEEQPTDEPPAPDGEEQPAPEEESGAPVVPGPGDEEIATDDGALGFLPSTGLEAGALGAIGLGLLMAGAALRPRRRVAAGRR